MLVNPSRPLPSTSSSSSPVGSVRNLGYTIVTIHGRIVAQGTRTGAINFVSIIIRTMASMGHGPWPMDDGRDEIGSRGSRGSVIVYRSAELCRRAPMSL